ncbi:hypothetical protein ABZ404_36795 [Streptomyces sp. NPDC005878]|uniref:hypothetical protein n=1 Tax=Streptomyces sp. NPDC005878 TaxID=3157077 RepID=UPI0033C0BE05
MDAAVRAWLLAQLGTSTDLADLDTRYLRLGSARAVAIEILYERKAELISQPATLNVSSVIAVGYTENIRALERQIAALENGMPPAPDDDAPGCDDDASGLGVLFLKERPRR